MGMGMVMGWVGIGICVVSLYYTAVHMQYAPCMRHIQHTGHCRVSSPLLFCKHVCLSPILPHGWYRIVSYVLRVRELVNVYFVNKMNPVIGTLI
jgi:hypothetical protein